MYSVLISDFSEFTKLGLILRVLFAHLYILNINFFQNVRRYVMYFFKSISFVNDYILTIICNTWTSLPHLFSYSLQSQRVLSYIDTLINCFTLVFYVTVVTLRSNLKQMWLSMALSQYITLLVFAHGSARVWRLSQQKVAYVLP